MITADTAIEQKYARQKNSFVFRRFRLFDVVMMPRWLTWYTSIVAINQTASSIHKNLFM